MTDFPDSLYLHGLNLMPQFGPARLTLLAEYFENFKQAFFATKNELEKAGIDGILAQSFIELRTQINFTKEQDALAREHISLLTFRDNNFPKLLLEIPKVPPLLYVRGQMNEPEELCVAVVGTRKITNYGRVITPLICVPLVDAGIVLVSGMAFGVDSLAHETAIKKGARTIAVLAGGLDEKSLYPKAHCLLAQKILDTGGALLSEYPPLTPNFKQNFVARNRIISGLSLATVVVECDLKSGTLITARHALDQNRQVYAAPGPIYSPQSQGPNNLLKMGAKPITRAEDVLEDLNLQTLPEQKATNKIFADTKEEAVILNLLSFDPIIIDELIKQTGLEPSVAASTLTFLEMKGKIKNLGGQQYILSR